MYHLCLSTCPCVSPQVRKLSVELAGSQPTQLFIGQVSDSPVAAKSIVQVRGVLEMVALMRGEGGGLGCVGC